MRSQIRLFPRVLLAAPALLLFAAPPPAHAQVTVDLRALDALPAAPYSLGGPARRAPAHPAPAHPAPARPAPAQRPAAPREAASALPAPPPPMPTAPPAAAAPLAPAPAGAVSTAAATPPAMPAAPPPPPGGAAAPPASASQAGAPQAATPTPAAAPPAAAPRPTPAPISIVFAKDATDLSDADIARLKALAAATQQGPEVSFDVTAYASGTPEDPSSARRLSLSRGLAVRAALVSAGVPSVRIYVRAMGLATGPGTPDRADVSVHGLSAASGAPHS